MHRALIVDDEGIERRGILMLVKRLELPFECMEASNGEEAVSLLQTGSFDLLITDIRMPFMDGLQLAHEAHRLKPELPIIVVSAYGDFSKAQRAIQENVFRYLLKPISAAEFKRVLLDVANLIDEKRAEHEHISTMERELNTYREKNIKDGADGTSDTAYSGSEKSYSHPIELALRIINEEYTSRISMNDVADRAYINASYFSTLFSQEVGDGFVHYLNNLRLEKASDMLLNTNRAVGDVGKLVGFSGDSYFITLFKNKYGCTPHQYRFECRTKEGRK